MMTEHLPTLGDIESVSMMVVNLFYTDPDILNEHGFGYLIPRSVPAVQNPECALGVVFDSHMSSHDDTVSGTKVTVMLGGHYWRSFVHYPDEEEGLRMAKNVLKRHLGIDVEPAASRVTLNEGCIPQYYVGHESRMIAADRDLKNHFGGKLAVTGSSYTGVGVNDCVTAAYQTVSAIDDSDSKVTGLEKIVRRARKYSVR